MNWINQLEFNRVKSKIEGLCQSDLSKNLLKSLLPLKNAEKIRNMQALICQCQKYLKTICTHNFSNLTDLKKSLHHTNYFDYEIFKQVNFCCIIAQDLIASWENIDPLEKENYPLLKNEFSSINHLGGLSTEFNKIFASDGAILDTASVNLLTIRNNQKKLNESINKLLTKKYLSSNCQYITHRDGRIVVLVSSATKPKGIIHDTSHSKNSVYLEPIELVSRNNTLKNLTFQERQEIIRIFENFTNLIKSFSKELLENQKILAFLDYNFTLAKFSNTLGSNSINIQEKPTLKLKDAYHPLLKLVLKEKTVPFEIEIGKDAKNFLIVSGPNTGGKTVFLKGVGLLSIMALSGLPIPASKDSEIGIFESFFVDILDMQSIENNLSSFSSHLEVIKETLEKANKKSLILFDEIGSSTDPEQGAALSCAIIDFLTRKGSFGIATTHFTMLKLFANKHPNCQNACMVFDNKRQKPNYFLNIGLPGGSFALDIAKNLGLNANVLEKAKQYLGKDNFSITELLTNLSKDKIIFEQKNRDLKKKLIELSHKINFYNKKLNYFKKNEKMIFKQQLHKAKEYFNSLQAELNLKLSSVKTSQSIEKILKKTVAINNKIYEKEYENRHPLKEIKIGQKVFVRSFDNNGKVISIDKRLIKVDIEGFEISTKISNLFSPIIKNPIDKQYISQKVISRIVPRELKLLGYDFLSAKIKVDEFIDDALLANLSSIRIVHGKGILSTKIRQYLKESNFQFSVPAENQGGDGVSEIQL